jgi:DNA-directed RNA polymerase subunit RPC12/RpoP
MIQYECNKCKIEFKTNSGLWKHNKLHHSNIKKETIFNCKHCQKELSNRHSLWRHENKVCKKNPIIQKPFANLNVQDSNDTNINVIQNQNIKNERFKNKYGCPS